MEVELSDFDLDQDSVRQQFLEITAYGDSDILAYNPKTRFFITRNGGRYQLSEAGKILHLAGPSPDPTERL